MQSTDVMTYKDAAAFLGISYTALRTLVARGELHSQRPYRSKVKVLRREDVECYKRGERPVSSSDQHALLPVEQQRNGSFWDELGSALQVPPAITPENRDTLLGICERFHAMSTEARLAQENIAKEARLAIEAFCSTLNDAKQLQTLGAAAMGALDRQRAEQSNQGELARAS